MSVRKSSLDCSSARSQFIYGVQSTEYEVFRSYHDSHKSDGSARIRRTSSNLNLCCLHVSGELLLVSDASLLQNVPGHGSTPNLTFANVFFRHLPCHRPTSSPYQHNATTTTNSRPRSVQTQRIASTTAVGQPGCRYLIDRVLQEKGVPPRRVYLATYVLLKLNYQYYLT